MGTSRCQAGLDAAVHKRQHLQMRSRQLNLRGWKCVSRRGGSCHEAGEERAGRRRGDGGIRSRCSLLHRRYLRGHGAVVRSTPPAAGRQSWVIAAFDRRRDWSQREEEDQEDGEAAPHVNSMVHEL